MYLYMKMINSSSTDFIIFCSLISGMICLPVCNDNIPFSTKLAQTSLVVYGDIIEVSTPVASNNHTKPFNITFLVKCTLKGIPPTNENIVIEHTLPENSLCYRTLVQGHTYVFFLTERNTGNHYKQMPFQELSLNHGSSVEILKRTCGIKIRPFRQIIKKTINEIDEQCPIVSVGCL